MPEDVRTQAERELGRLERTSEQSPEYGWIRTYLDWLLEVPWTLHWFQWVLMAAELTAPLIFFLSERWRRRVVLGWFVFHAMTYGAITIAFWPHLVMMLAFLPLEEYAAWLRERVGRRRARKPVGAAG